jgi:hypothetical protein
MDGTPSRPLFAIGFAAFAVAARLPFLITGKIPFDSDEAIQGLMARHVLNGELPAFFWGQPFKGVPEVYVSAALFSMFGSNVTALKAITLALFAIFVALQFVLLDRIASRWVAVAAALLLIVSPPTLVFWSLWAGAEYMLIMLLGTTLLLIAEGARSRGSVSKGLLLAIGFIIGFGLWDHQLFVIYLIPLGVTLAVKGHWWTRREPRTPHIVVLVLAAIGGLYVVLGVIAFVSGGFTLQLGSIAISATAPQKMIRIAAGIFALATLVHLAGTATWPQTRDVLRRYWPVAAGFLIGYAPALLYAIRVAAPQSPMRLINAQGLIRASPDIFGNIVPILAGYKIGTTERLALPALSAVPAAAALVAYVWSTRHLLTKAFFPLFVVFMPAFFLLSGAYIDTQSHRYLIPWYAGLSVAWGAGSLVLAGNRKTLATAIVASILAVHAWQQVLWYRKLQPDTQSLATIDCLKRNGIRGGYAEYWTAYKLTFLARENIIVAPADGIDRYPAYTEYVRSLPPGERIGDAARCN